MKFIERFPADMLSFLLTTSVLAGYTAAQAVDNQTAQLTNALQRIVNQTDGPPGIAVVIQRNTSVPTLYIAGFANVETRQPWTLDTSMRIASVAKAFSGAAALALVGQGRLSPKSTIGQVLGTRYAYPSLWGNITLQQLLQHTGGLPDYTTSSAFQAAVVESLTVAPQPEALLAYVANASLTSTPGTVYNYSNTDNIVVGLMVQAVTNTSYTSALTTLVGQRFNLSNVTNIPAGLTLPSPNARGYEISPPNAPQDLTEVLSPGWTWASGGIISTPRDLNSFIRGYAAGSQTNSAGYAAQFQFRNGSSQPPGPESNSAGMGIFRYETSCGSVYGHTGNILGYTQFIAATQDGTRSTTVSINSQLSAVMNPSRFTDLRNIFQLAVCAALS